MGIDELRGMAGYFVLIMGVCAMFLAITLD